MSDIEKQIFCLHDWVAQTWNTSICLKCKKIRHHIKSVDVSDSEVKDEP